VMKSRKQQNRGVLSLDQTPLKPFQPFYPSSTPTTLTVESNEAIFRASLCMGLDCY
jgi:hypothetical protein